jgi:hypothetical protein
MRLFNVNRSQTLALVATALYPAQPRSYARSVMSAALTDQPHRRSIDPMLIVKTHAPGKGCYVTIFVHLIVVSKTQPLA